MTVLAGVPAYQVLDSARTHLNDDSVLRWPDSILMPKLQEAHRQLQIELLRHGIPVFTDIAAELTIPGINNDGTYVDLTTISGYPTNLITPIKLQEKWPGQTDDYLVDMTQVDEFPTIELDTYNVFWKWQNQKIFVFGALDTTVVRIFYRGGIPVPQTNNDVTGIILGEIYLSYRVAAIAFGSVGNYAAKKEMMAEATANLEQIVQVNVRELQDLPARRRPYHRGRKGRLPMIIGGQPNLPMAAPVGWVTINYTGGITPLVDLTLGNTYEYVLMASGALIGPPNLYTASGQFQIVITQDSVGGRTVNFDTSFQGIDPTQFDTTPNLSTVLTFTIKGYSNYILTSAPTSYVSTE